MRAGRRWYIETRTLYLRRVSRTWLNGNWQQHLPLATQWCALNRQLDDCFEAVCCLLSHILSTYLRWTIRNYSEWMVGHSQSKVDEKERVRSDFEWMPILINCLITLDTRAHFLWQDNAYNVIQIPYSYSLRITIQICRNWNVPTTLSSYQYSEAKFN